MYDYESDDNEEVNEGKNNDATVSQKSMDSKEKQLHKYSFRFDKF
jgi:hypothetical protein